MKIKIDENIPVSIKDILLKEGFDTQSVYDESLSGIDDESLIKICNIEKRILITLDIGFSKQAFSQGLIILRPSRQSFPIIRKMIHLLIDTLKKRKIEEHEIWIVEEARIRIRKL